MIYLASRSAWKYLRKLREISLRQIPYHLVSITGGLASLHAVNSKTRSLKFVDSDPEVNEYGKCIIEALLSCPTRGDFFELLSGREVQLNESGGIVFSKNLSTNRTLLLNKLSPVTASCITRWYVPSSFNDETATMTAEDKTVHFFGLSLQIQHFNWHADWGVFRSEESYQELIQTLIRIKPSFLTLPLEQYDFVRCAADTLILASNTDSPLFTEKDAVLNAIEESKCENCRYISRTRDFSTPSPERKSLRYQTLKVPPVLVGIPEEVQDELRKIFPYNYVVKSYPEYLRQLFYDEELLLFWASQEGSEPRTLLLDHLKFHQPIHQRIGVMVPPGEEISPIFSDILKRYELQETVTLKHGTLAVFTLSFRSPY